MMQNKVGMLVLVAGLAAPLAASADTANFSFYGIADVSYDMVNTGDGTTTANGAIAVSGVSKRVVSSNVSRFGFKGSEDFGNGLSALWQIEQQVNIDNSSNACSTTVPAVAAGAAAPAVTVACNSNNGIFATRNTYAALKSASFGTILLGRHDTPYKISTRRLDVFGDNIADNRALLGNKSNLGFEQRPTDILAYTTPAFAGVTASIATVNLSEGNTTSGPLPAQDQKSNSILSMAVMYDAAPFYVAVATESHKLETVAAGAKESANRFGIGFTQDRFSIGVVYEKITDNLATLPTASSDRYGHTALYLGGKVNLGDDAVKFAYGKAGDIANTTSVAVPVKDTAAKQISIGYDFGLSKRTKLYALYTKITNGKGANYGFSQSSAASSSNAGYGTSPTVLSLGMKQTF